MQIERYDGEPERTILISFITSVEFLAKVSPKWDMTLFRSEWSAIIGDWCVSYFKKHGRAPGKKIVSLFHTWAEKSQNEDVRKSINRLLVSLSRQYDSLAEEVVISYSLELAEGYFNLVGIEKHIEDLKLDKERGHTENALVKAEAFRRLVFTEDAGIDVFRDKEAQRNALERRSKALIRYKDGLGAFFQDELCEGSLICLVAPMKVGKSYYMLDMGWKAQRQGKNVAYFQIGDLSQDQVMQRFQCRAAYRPIKARLVRMPISICPAQHGLAQVDFDVKPYDKDMTVEEGQAAYEKAVKDEKHLRFRLCWRPTLSVSIADIKKQLDTWERNEGWKAQVIVIDYSENLGPVNPKKTELFQVEESWALMSQLREEKKACVITAIQAPKEAFNAWVMTRRHFSKNKMIFAHATAIIGINITDEEKKNQTARLNIIAWRGEDSSETKCCYLAECRDIAHISVCSQF